MNTRRNFLRLMTGAGTAALWPVAAWAKAPRPHGIVETQGVTMYGRLLPGMKPMVFHDETVFVDFSKGRVGLRPTKQTPYTWQVRLDEVRRVLAAANMPNAFLYSSGSATLEVFTSTKRQHYDGLVTLQATSDEFRFLMHDPDHEAKDAAVFWVKREVVEDLVRRGDPK